MRSRFAGLLLVSLAFGCQTSADDLPDAAPEDASVDASADASPIDPPPDDFEVRVAHDGVDLIDGATLPVEFGCQGGSHVELDVFAVGEGLDGAEVEIRVETETRLAELTNTLRAGDGGAELLGAAASFGGFGSYDSPGYWTYPTTATVSVRVTAADGSGGHALATVAIGMGSVCDPTCHYDDIPGTAHLGEVTVTGATDGCDLATVRLSFSYTPDDPSRTLAYDDGSDGFLDQSWPARCVEALGLAAGADTSVIRHEQLPGGGTCSPVYYTVAFDPAGCDCP